MLDAISRTRTSARPLAAAALAVSTVLAVAAVSFASSAQAAATDVPLGTAARFAVLAGSGVTNTGDTNIDRSDDTAVTGDVGSAGSTSDVTGGQLIDTVGVIRGDGDGVTTGAKPDLVAAFDFAAAAEPRIAMASGIGGELTPLNPGVYNNAADVLLTGPIVLDGKGDPNSVFIFQVGQDFTTAPGASVSLVNGAQACHVYWQIGRSAVFDTTTTFVGTVMALTSITANTNANFEGRLLARNGAVTLDDNDITVPACAAALPSTPAPTTSAPSTPAPTATSPVRARPTPTRTPRDDDSDTGDNDSDGGGESSDGGSDDSDGGGGSGTDTDADGTYTTTGIPNAGGPSALLAPIGAVAVLAGAGLVLASRRRSTGRA
nr:hypothetical protein [Aeromicrobium sp.]